MCGRISSGRRRKTNQLERGGRLPIERKLRQLERLIPGCGHGIEGVENLLQRTEEYLFLLHLKLSLLRILSTCYGV
ncbi:hypothetical protein SLA2020_518760 [Shorea laevis]